FEAGQIVDVIGTSKGRGTQGVVKRHHFSMQKWTHGTHEGFRSPGSIGPGSYPAHVIKGLRMAGRMGNEQVTVRNVEVVKVDAKKNLLMVRGAVPGRNDGVVRVRSAIKPPRAKQGPGGKKESPAPLDRLEAAMAYERKDVFHQRAKREGFRSRAAYKLDELQREHRLIRAGDRVVDLGCWPGGWMQVAAELVGARGRVVGIDLPQLDSPPFAHSVAS